MLFEQILSAARVVRRRLEEPLQQASLGDAQLLLLWACRRAGSRGIGQRELAQRLGVSAAQVSGLVEELRQREWLEGHRPAEDRRRQVWRLTARGEEALNQLEPTLLPWAGQFLSAVRPTDSTETEFVETIGRLLEMSSSDEVSDSLEASPTRLRGAA